MPRRAPPAAVVFRTRLEWPNNDAFDKDDGKEVHPGANDLIDGLDAEVEQNSLPLYEPNEDSLDALEVLVIPPHTSKNNEHGKDG